MALQLRRGTNAERAAETFAVGELIYTTDTKQIYVGDGSTQGGVLVSSSAASSPASLTQNLSLNGFNISGTGNISATAFVGDGSGLTGIASGAGVEEGQEYSIDIQGNVRGDDTTVLVDAALGRVSADHYGDGSNLTGITLNQLSNVDTTGVTTNSILKYDGAEWVIGVDGGGGGDTGSFTFTGTIMDTDDSSTITITPSVNMSSDLIVENNITSDSFTGDILARDSSRTPIINANANEIATNAVVANTINSFINTQRYIEPDTGFDTVTVRPKSEVGQAGITLESNDEQPILNLRRITDSDIDGNTSLSYGQISFGRDDANGKMTPVLNLGYEDKWVVAVNESGSGFTEPQHLIFDTNGRLAIGTFTPGATLDVAGDVKIGSFTTTERNALTGANGMMLYNSTDNVFQVYENGAWVAMRDGVGGGGGGASSFTNIGISADDSTIRLINEGESVGILGGTAITTTSDAEGNITINGVAQDFTWASITNTPNTISGYGITDALDLSDLGNFAFSGNVMDSGDSGAITITPAVTISSDLTVENDLVVSNTVTADKFISTGTETPEISASANLNLTAGNAVVVTSSALRMASFTTTERNALAAQNGDIIYNTTDNKFQGYENGAWANLI